MPPQLNAEPVQYIVPLLHLLLFFDEFVEKVSAKEVTIQDNIADFESYIMYVNEEIGILKVNKNMTYLELSEGGNNADLPGI